MSKSQILILLLLINIILVDGITLVSVDTSQGLTPSKVFMLALAISQVGLLAIWTTWGRTGIFLRLVLLLTVAVAWGYGLRIRMEPNYPSDQGTIFLAIISAIILMGSLLMRLLKWRIICVSHGLDPLDTESNKSRFQFSLRHIIIITTFAAIVFGIFRLLEVKWSKFFGNPVSFAAVMSAWSLPTLFLARGVLSLRRFWIRMPLSIVLSIGLGCLATLTLGNPDFFLDFMAWQISLTVLMLVVIRAAGYRFVQTKVRLDPMAALPPITSET